MKAHFLSCFLLWAACSSAQGGHQPTPEVKSVLIEEGAVTPVYLKAGYTTSVRLPEEVSSVVVGNPQTFKAEHSAAEPRLVFIKPVTSRPAESNALITTKSGQEISLHLISQGQAGAGRRVDFLVEVKRPKSLLISQPNGPSLFAAEARPTLTKKQPDSNGAPGDADPVARILATQKAVASPRWQGTTLELSIGESVDVDHQMLLGFSVLNNSRHVIELLPPQIVLNGRSVKGKKIKADPIGVLEFHMTTTRLDPGERADGVVVFERPTFKESSEGMELQVAESDQVDHPARTPIPFVATTRGVSQ